MASITTTDLGRLRAWMSQTVGQVEHPDAAPIVWTLILEEHQTSLRDPDVFEHVAVGSPEGKAWIGRYLDAPGAREALADSYDAFRRLVEGRAGAVAPSPAGPAEPRGRKEELLAHVLGGSPLAPRSERRPREEQFLRDARALDDDDLVWLRNQLTTRGELTLAAVVAFLIPYRHATDPAAPRKDPEQVAAEEGPAYASLQAAAEGITDVVTLAWLGREVLSLLPDDEPSIQRFLAAHPAFVRRMRRVAAEETWGKHPPEELRIIVQFHTAAGRLVAMHAVPGIAKSVRVPGDVADLLDHHTDGAAFALEQMGNFDDAARVSHQGALALSHVDPRRAISYFDRAAEAYERWLLRYPQAPVEVVLEDGREPLFRNQGYLRAHDITVRLDAGVALFRRAEALGDALSMAEAADDERAYRRLSGLYDKALEDLARRVGEVDRRTAETLREHGDMQVRYGSYLEFLSSPPSGYSPLTVMLLSNIILRTLEGDEDAQAAAGQIESILDAQPAIPLSKAFVRSIVEMPQDNEEGRWRIHPPTPEMVAAARGENAGSFWNGIFELVGGPARSVGMELGAYAMLLERADVPQSGMWRPLVERFVSLSRQHAARDFEFRRILSAVLSRSVRGSDGRAYFQNPAEHEEGFFEPLERIARLLENPHTYEAGLRAGAVYAGIPFRGQSPHGGMPPPSGSAGSGSAPAGSGGGAAGSGHGGSGSIEPMGIHGPQLSFAALVVVAEDSTPVPAGDPDAADTTADAGAELYLGADVTGVVPSMPAAAPAATPMR